MDHKVLLLILDGFGLGPKNEHNAIHLANTPFLDHAMAHYPMNALHASGEHVGALPGFIGTSEVGHLIMGAGRIVHQDIARIHNAIHDRSFYENAAFTEAITHAKRNNSTLHLIGLVSPGGVHSHSAHLIALLQLAAQSGLQRVSVHAFLDGRDTPPFSAREYITQLAHEMHAINPQFTIATVTGRHFAMDRNENWERTLATFQLLFAGSGRIFADPLSAIAYFYEQKIADEFIEPCAITSGFTPITDNDNVICFNFRSDRMRQLAALLVNARPDVHTHTTRNLSIATMTAYEDNPEGVAVAFPDKTVANHLTEVISNAGLPQLKITETEKYAHLTYFFNGGREAAYAAEERVMVPSPRVAHFEETPHMAAAEITQALSAALAQKAYPFIAVNYCNADMIGHTGDLAAAVKGIAFMDQCLSQGVAQAQRQGYDILITADHGNAEEMYDPTINSRHTAHTRNLVPCILLTHKQYSLAGEGTLAHIAPTILELLGIARPPEMTTSSLLTL